MSSWTDIDSLKIVQIQRLGYEHHWLFIRMRVNRSWCPFVRWEEHETKQVVDCFLIKFNLFLNLINHSVGLCALTILIHFFQDWQCKNMVESWSYNHEISLLGLLLFSLLGNRRFLGDVNEFHFSYNKLHVCVCSLFDSPVSLWRQTITLIRSPLYKKKFD